LIKHEKHDCFAYFDVFELNVNLFAHHNGSENNTQFSFEVYLQATNKYALIVSMYSSNVMRNFLMLACKHFFLSTQFTNLHLLMFYLIDTPSLLPILVPQATYTSELTKNSRKYFRDCTEPNYYYKAIQVNVTQDGFYAFVTDSTMDTFGSLYKSKFNPINPSENQIKEDDNSGSNGQFNLQHDLQKQMTYILVVTTYRPNVTGSFSIVALGENNVTLEHISE
jgi:hypothetical protein